MVFNTYESFSPFMHTFVVHVFASDSTALFIRLGTFARRKDSIIHKCGRVIIKLIIKPYSNDITSVTCNFIQYGFINYQLLNTSPNIALSISLFTRYSVVNLTMMLKESVNTTCVQLEHQILTCYWSIILGDICVLRFWNTCFG